MSNRQLLLLVLIVCLPLAVLGWLGVRLAREESRLAEQQVRELLQGQLRDTNQKIARRFSQAEGELLTLTRLPSLDPAQLRELVRRQPQISQLFVLKADGRLLHPDLNGNPNAAERQFMVRAARFLRDKDLIWNAREAKNRAGKNRAGKNRAGKNRAGKNRAGKSSAEGSSAAPPHGWYVWYWERGLNLIFWRQREDGRIVGVELTRARWISDLIVELPQTPFEQSAAAQSRIRLTDSNDNTIYQWGDYEPPPAAQAFVDLPVREPLSSWRLRYYVAPQQLTALAARSAYFNLFSALTVIGLGLLGLAFYFYRESSRELREAATRVSFVNQVSHELKTPLTNIRMYAELLERELGQLPTAAADGARQRLDVIVKESGRLSRLITNVLTFARQQRKQVALKLAVGRIDSVIRKVVEFFQPTLEAQGVSTRVSGGCDQPARFDADALEQILVNLVSNVEKYAARGGVLEICSLREGDRVTIQVADRGPGIPPAARERIFQPFHREADALEGAAGAGIGLSIARSLARLHGGDVTLGDAPHGACFSVEIHAPTINADPPKNHSTQRTADAFSPGGDP